MFNFFNSTVDTIIADFHKVVTRLEDFADVELNKAEALYKAAQDHLKEREEKLVHVARASKIATKIKDLIEGV